MSVTTDTTLFAFSEETVMFQDSQKRDQKSKEYCPCSTNLWMAYADSEEQ